MSSNLHHESVFPPEKTQQQQERADDTASIRTASTTHQTPNIEHLHTQISLTQDAPIQPYSSYLEVPDEVYDRLSHSKKVTIVTLLSFCSFLAPISSTTILSAIPEVAVRTTRPVINSPLAMTLGS